MHLYKSKCNKSLLKNEKSYYWLNLNILSSIWVHKEVVLQTSLLSYRISHFIFLFTEYFSCMLSVKCLIFGSASELNQKWGEEPISDVIKPCNIKYFCLQRSNFHVLSQGRVPLFYYSLRRILCFFFFNVT